MFSLPISIADLDETRGKLLSDLVQQAIDEGDSFPYKVHVQFQSAKNHECLPMQGKWKHFFGSNFIQI